MLNIPEATPRLLESDGYAWKQEREAWVHPRTGGKVPGVFTPELVAISIKVGGQ